jgi:hypothetical protein
MSYDKWVSVPSNLKTMGQLWDNDLTIIEESEPIANFYLNSSFFGENAEYSHFRAFPLYDLGNIKSFIANKDSLNMENLCSALFFLNNEVKDTVYDVVWLEEHEYLYELKRTVIYLLHGENRISLVGYDRKRKGKKPSLIFEYKRKNNRFTHRFHVPCTENDINGLTDIGGNRFGAGSIAYANPYNYSKQEAEKLLRDFLNNYPTSYSDS